MKDSVKQFLKAIGVDSNTMEALSQDNAPDTFNIEDASKAYISKRRELVLNDGDFQKQMKQKYNKDLYPAIVKPLLKELKRSTGLTDEQLKSITPEGQNLPDMKRAIGLGIETYSKTASSGVDEVKRELFEWKSKYENASTAWNEEKQNLITGFEKQRKQEKVQRHFERAVNKMELILPKEAANTMLSADLMNRYNFDVNDTGELQVFTKDGNKVDDGNNFLSAEDVIKRRASEFKILKVSNGGDGGNAGGDGNKKPIPLERADKSQLSPAVLRMMERAKDTRR